MILFKLIKNPQKRGLVQYWWTGRSYPFFRGIRSCKRRIMELEAQNAKAFEGSIFWYSLDIAIKGKYNSILNLFELETWRRLINLLKVANADESQNG